MHAHAHAHAHMHAVHLEVLSYVLFWVHPGDFQLTGKANGNICILLSSDRIEAIDFRKQMEDGRQLCLCRLVAD